jgi:hypothetical protein
METNACAEMEDQRCEVWLFPTCGQGRSELKICVVIHEPIEQNGVDALRLRVGADARIEIGGAALDEEDNGLRVSWR